MVIETLLWFVSDSRGGLHETLVQKEKEYQQHQVNVLAAATEDAQLEEEEEEDATHERRRQQQESSRGERGEGIDGDGSGGSDAPNDNPANPLVTFQMGDLSDNEEENLDESVQQEIRMKETNRRAYFDTLDDILE